MTDVKLLRDTIDRKGVKICKVCSALNVSGPTLRRKMKGEQPFKQSEIVKMRDFLSLTDDEVHEIFLR
jgi:hypothetical protein